MRRMLGVRRQFSVFGTGTFEALPCANPSVLAFVRSARPTQTAQGLDVVPGTDGLSGALHDAQRTVLSSTT
jgi:hypothetical protein